MNLPRIIAIDGPAGSGKSTIASVVARDLGYLFVDTGVFYRAVTLAAIRAAIKDEAGINELATHNSFDLKEAPAESAHDYLIFLNGEDITDHVRTKEVEGFVSDVSAMQTVRHALNIKYRELASRGMIIMAGRDIGTVVLPDAPLKIYMDASPENRAKRRLLQLIAAGKNGNYEDTLAAMKERDKKDSTREVDPLRRADDALYLNTDDLSEDQAIDALRAIIVGYEGHKLHE